MELAVPTSFESSELRGKQLEVELADDSVGSVQGFSSLRTWPIKTAAFCAPSTGMET